MYKVLFIVLLVVFTSPFAVAQEKLTWADFADITFEPEYNEKYDVHFLMPKFGEKIKSYMGKQVSIRGFFLDISGGGEMFLVSQNPMASCFFFVGQQDRNLLLKSILRNHRRLKRIKLLQLPESSSSIKMM